MKPNFSHWTGPRLWGLWRQGQTGPVALDLLPKPGRRAVSPGTAETPLLAPALTRDVTRARRLASAPALYFYRATFLWTAWHSLCDRLPSRLASSAPGRTAYGHQRSVGDLDTPLSVTLTLPACSMDSSKQWATVQWETMGTSDPASMARAFRLSPL